MESTPINELKAFLLTVSKQGSQHVSEIEADLAQTRYLLNEAVQNLGNGFANVHALIQAQQALMQEVVAAAPSKQAQLAEKSQAIDEEINRIVTCMQFQDITNQLLQRTMEQANALGALLAALSQEQGDAPKPDDVMDYLLAAHATLTAQHGDFENSLKHSIAQKDLGTGDVDLF